MTRVHALLFAAAMLVACGKKKEEAPAPTPPAAAPAVADAATGSGAGSSQPAAATNQPAAGSDQAAAAGSAVDVPTTADFEDQAAKDITDKNYEAHLKQMEAELSQ
jgi:hypothetical protein